MQTRDLHLEVLRKLSLNPRYTQRQLSQEMGVSLGKINYCIQKLTAKGWIKLKNFKKNKNKVGYVYQLTPTGIENKAILTLRFLKLKIKEYELLKKEIKLLKKDTELLDNF